MAGLPWGRIGDGLCCDRDVGVIVDDGPTRGTADNRADGQAVQHKLEVFIGADMVVSGHSQHEGRAGGTRSKHHGSVGQVAPRRVAGIKVVSAEQGRALRINTPRQVQRLARVARARDGVEHLLDGAFCAFNNLAVLCRCNDKVAGGVGKRAVLHAHAGGVAGRVKHIAATRGVVFQCHPDLAQGFLGGAGGHQNGDACGAGARSKGHRARWHNAVGEVAGLHPIKRPVHRSCAVSGAAGHLERDGHKLARCRGIEYGVRQRLNAEKSSHTCNRNGKRRRGGATHGHAIDFQRRALAIVLHHAGGNVVRGVVQLWHETPGKVGAHRRVAQKGVAVINREPLVCSQRCVQLP